MKKLLLGVILAAVASTGCYRVYLTPRVEAVVVNDCKEGSILWLSGPRIRRPVPIEYGEEFRVTFEASMGRIQENPLLMVRGRGETGEYLGSQSRNFYVNRNGVREDAWHVRSLQGGKGCGR